MKTVKTEPLKHSGSVNVVDFGEGILEAEITVGTQTVRLSQDEVKQVAGLMASEVDEPEAERSYSLANGQSVSVFRDTVQFYDSDDEAVSLSYRDYDRLHSFIQRNRDDNDD